MYIINTIYNGDAHLFSNSLLIIDNLTYTIGNWHVV